MYGGQVMCVLRSTTCSTNRELRTMLELRSDLQSTGIEILYKKGTFDSTNGTSTRSSPIKNAHLFPKDFEEYCCHISCIVLCLRSQSNFLQVEESGSHCFAPKGLL